MDRDLKVNVDYKNIDYHIEECEEGRRYGFTGKVSGGLFIRDC